MKPYLLKAISIALLYATILIPLKSKAQCTCEGGVPATTIEHLVVLDTIVTSSTPITFPQFDPTIGTLVCVKLDDTISVVSTTGIRNLDPDTTLYEFNLTVTTNVSGPGLSRNTARMTDYGPDLLTPYETVGDSINYGPDTLYKDVVSTRTNSSNVAAYLGSGNVNFVYSIGGGTIAYGGANFNSRMRTTSWGIFKLTYSWCPSAVLAAAVKNIKATPGNDNIRFSWTVPNEINHNIYEIEISENGKDFYGVGTSRPQFVDGVTSEYSYQYTPDQPISGKLYYRIKQTDGKNVKYSTINSVSTTFHSSAQVAVYPNPAYRNLNMEFKNPLSGDFHIELTNQAGQVIYNNRQKLQNSKNIQLFLDNPPQAGLYFLRATDRLSGRSFTGKLILKQ